MYTEQNKGFTVITNFGCDRSKKKVQDYKKSN